MSTYLARYLAGFYPRSNRPQETALSRLRFVPVGVREQQTREFAIRHSAFPRDARCFAERSKTET